MPHPTRMGYEVQSPCHTPRAWAVRCKARTAPHAIGLRGAGPSTWRRGGHGLCSRVPAMHAHARTTALPPPPHPADPRQVPRDRVRRDHRGQLLHAAGELFLPLGAGAAHACAEHVQGPELRGNGLLRACAAIHAARPHAPESGPGPPCARRSVTQGSSTCSSCPTCTGTSSATCARA